MPKKIVEAGCVNIFLGFESGNDVTLQRINKNTSVSIIHEIIHKITDFPLKITGNFIIGFPNEDMRSIENTLMMVKQLRELNHNASLQEFLLNRGSYYWEVRKDLIKDVSYLSQLETNDTIINFRYPREQNMQTRINQMLEEYK